MKVKKYVAPSMPEAMKQIRAELGSEAVILNSKVIHTGGFLGLFKKRNIEVIAAIDPKPKQEPIVKIKDRSKPAPKQAPVFKQEVLLNSKAKEEKLEDKPSQEVLNELSELKALIKNLPLSNEGSSDIYPGPIKEIQQQLIEMEIDPIYREELLTSLLEKWYITGADASKENIREWVKEIVKKNISTQPCGGLSFTKKYINVVGPTGVGKTTTLAKIAAECVLKHKKKVAFITTDTYRIAAIEQLKTYAKILNIPIEVCYNIDDFKKACNQFNEFEMVLIDTAGRNFRNKQYVEDLKLILDFEKNIETYLVLSLTAKQKDMEEIYKQFTLIDIDKFIFTKADETSTYGAIFNLMKKYNKGTAYLTNGQNVPDDMIEAKPEVIANTILGDDLHE